MYEIFPFGDISSKVFPLTDILCIGFFPDFELFLHPGYNLFANYLFHEIGVILTLLVGDINHFLLLAFQEISNLAENPEGNQMIRVHCILSSREPNEVFEVLANVSPLYVDGDEWLIHEHLFIFQTILQGLSALVGGEVVPGLGYFTHCFQEEHTGEGQFYLLVLLVLVLEHAQVPAHVVLEDVETGRVYSSGRTGQEFDGHWGVLVLDHPDEYHEYTGEDGLSVAIAEVLVRLRNGE